MEALSHYIEDKMDFSHLTKANENRRQEWDKDSKMTILFHANELAGEVGEACNVVKKLEREKLGIVGSRATLDDLANELADVVIVADLIASMAGINLEAAVARKFNATSKARGFLTLFSNVPEVVVCKTKSV